MTEETYKYIEDSLCAVFENTNMMGAGSGDKSVNKQTEAMLCTLFCRYIHGDEAGDPVFRMDRGEKLYVFNGRYYEAAKYENLELAITRVMERMDVEELYRVYSPPLIARRCWNGIMASWRCAFRPDRNFIAFNNGIYDLKKRVLKPFGGKYLTDLRMDFDYRSGWSHPLWDKKLEEIIPDAGMREALQMFFGCLLVDRDEIKVEYICFLLGAGGNGKSVLVDAVVNTFGSDLFSRFSPEQLFKSQQSMFNLAALEGKLANFCDDVSNKDFSGGDFKSFVSGAEFEARRPYGHNTFMVKAPFFICCANEMPPTTDDTDGFHRRFLVITSCNKTWTGAEKDPQLTNKLKAVEVRQAIFNWVLEGYYKVIECQGNIPLGESVVETQKAIREDSNSARRWIRDAGLVAVSPTSRNDARWRRLSAWYMDYKQYCDENGERSPQKANSISKLFKALGFAYERRSDGNWFCIGRASEGDGEAMAFDGAVAEGDEIRASVRAERREYWEQERRQREADEEMLPF